MTRTATDAGKIRLVLALVVVPFAATIVALADEVTRLKALPHVRRDCRDCVWWAPYDDDPAARSGVCRPLHQQTMARFGGCDDHYLAKGEA